MLELFIKKNEKGEMESTGMHEIEMNHISRHRTQYMEEKEL